MSALQRALSATGDAELIRIADVGLHALTGDFRTPLQAALLDAQRASGEERAKALEKAATIADQFLDYLDQEEIVKVVDGNPFNVKMSVRDTLGPALERIIEAV